MISDNKEITLRDWFAVNSPESKDSDIEYEKTRDRNANPHNDPHRPRIRSRREIECELRYKWADMMVSLRNSTPRYKDI